MVQTCKYNKFGKIDVQSPYRWKLLVGRWEISYHRTQIIFTLDNRCNSSDTNNSLVSCNTGSAWLTTLYKPFVRYRWARTTNSSCTEFTCCTTLYPLVHGIPSFILKDAIPHYKLTLYQISDRLNCSIQNRTSDHSTAERLFSWIQSKNS